MTVHGTRRGYQYAKCRCELCRQWMRDAAKVRRDKARAAQPSQWIAPAPVAAHIRTQLDNGWPANAVAKAAGVTNKVIYAALAGKATKMSTATAAKILAVNLPPTRPPRPASAPREPHSICCTLCDDIGWLLTNGETVPLVATRLGMSEESVEHHTRTYLPHVWASLRREARLIEEYA